MTFMTFSDVTRFLDPTSQTINESHFSSFGGPQQRFLDFCHLEASLWDTTAFRDTNVLRLLEVVKLNGNSHIVKEANKKMFLER